ncbi:uncharacterized protein J4E92_001982 [Alternaria infectoria]|uniref:uncharacterized protein n=1 Tax=Alternaria infectoria TaxID=45303 RepID=UPI0022211DEA|nr:uncharacterized protein J4E92_001982 [Alternaria infectoria]KAI4937252.1 hypothetical protein J4E92_001982 [Alternaria infectoria]
MSTPQPANALEQRIYDLMRPFRNECYKAPDTVDQVAAANRAVKLERRILVLAQNIAFLAHNDVASTGQTLNASDIFVVMRGWTGDGVAKTGGAIAVLARYPEGTTGVVKATFDAGVSVVDALCTKVDEMLAASF